MDNSLTQIWNQFRDTWESVTVEIEATSSNGPLEEYNACLFLDGKILETVLVTIIQTVGVHPIKTALLRFEHYGPYTQSQVDPMQPAHPMRGLDPWERQFNQIYHDKRQRVVIGALKAKGFVVDSYHPVNLGTDHSWTGYRSQTGK